MTRRKNITEEEFMDIHDNHLVPVVERLRMPKPLVAKLNEMCEEREMTRSALITELVVLGLQSLRIEPVQLEDFIHNPDNYQHTSGVGFD